MKFFLCCLIFKNIHLTITIFKNYSTKKKIIFFIYNLFYIFLINLEIKINTYFSNGLVYLYPSRTNAINKFKIIMTIIVKT